MHLAPRPAALRTSEPRPLRKIDLQIQPALLSIEPDIDHLPRRLQAKGLLKQNSTASLMPGSHHRGSEARQALSRPGRLPTQDVEEPNRVSGAVGS
jgi:hypothetical protein